MSRRAQVRGRCVFCESESVTKEHVFAKSLTKLFDGQGGAGTDHIVRHVHSHPERGDTTVKRAKTFALLSRKMCRTCNGGWMRKADENVRPLLAAFARNEPVVLTRVEQERLAFWTTKTLFALLTLEPKEFRFATADRYHELNQERRPLGGSQVWLGANNHGDLAWARSHSLRFDATVSENGGFGATLSFGYAVMHFMYHGLDDWRLRLRYNVHRSLTQIWPVLPAVRWPPHLRMTTTDLTPLALDINEFSAWARVEPGTLAA